MDWSTNLTETLAQQMEYLLDAVQKEVSLTGNSG
jgi:hypothetical protein